MPRQNYVMTAKQLFRYDERPENILIETYAGKDWAFTWSENFNPIENMSQLAHEVLRTAIESQPYMLDFELTIGKKYITLNSPTTQEVVKAMQRFPLADFISGCGMRNSVLAGGKGVRLVRDPALDHEAVFKEADRIARIRIDKRMTGRK